MDTEQFQNFSFFQVFLLVGFLWMLLTVFLWANLQLLMNSLGIKSIYGKTLSFRECLKLGPVCCIYIPLAITCPEVLEMIITPSEDDDDKEQN